MGICGQGPVGLIIKNGEHEQNRVSSEITSGVNLHGINNKILAQDGKMGRRRYGGQVVIIAAEAFGLAEHRDSRGIAGILPSNGPRLIMLPDQPQGGRGGFTFHDEGIGPLPEGLSQGAGGRHERMRVDMTYPLGNAGEMTASGGDDAF